MLANALNTLLHLHSKPFTLSRPGTMQSGTVRAAPSNYYRNLQGPSETIVKGREFVISKISLDVIGFTDIKRGDKLQSNDLGVLTINEITEMYDFGGAIMGYRVRTN